MLNPVERPGQEDFDGPSAAALALRGERAGLAVARFQNGDVDLVTGGTAGDLLIARAARPRAQSLRFDPVAGLFGLSFQRLDGPLADSAVRDALAMAIDRAAIVAALGVPGLQPRSSLVPTGIGELSSPASPTWSAQPVALRRATAARIIGATASDNGIEVSVAVPEQPGYDLIFAQLRRDWRAIGVAAVKARPDARADLVLVDRVAAVTMASWYLRSFTCSQGPACSPVADEAMEEARLAPDMATRRQKLAEADRQLRDVVVFIALTAPVRWSLVSDRLSGWQPNIFARHWPGQLVAPAR